ncbi:MAG: RNA 2'-phosphotransferase [Pirellulaceae bacterium]|jgi:putative RNA 2'-phosphotransferase|nr:RNA 2'-phosphotransferase [Pirellulaceae bacterium]
MNTEQLKKISKSLSYVLRHRPDTIGIELQPGGWIAVESLLAAMGQSGRRLSLDTLHKIVAENDKQRFEFSDDGARIRARQGHSVEVDLQYEPAVPPGVLYHGTATRFLDSIKQQGLVKGRRQHVHLSTSRETMIQVAMRHGKPVLLAIDSGQMHAAGHAFFVTGNHVWLTDHVPPQYLAVVDG